MKLVCNVNIVYGNLKSENSQEYAQKPQRNSTFMNSASVQVADPSPPPPPPGAGTRCGERKVLMMN